MTYPNLQAEIGRIQKISLSRALREAGIPYDEFIGDACRNITAAHVNDAGELVNAPEGFSFPLNGEDDFWRYRNYDASGMIELASEAIEEAASVGALGRFRLQHEILRDDLRRVGVAVPEGSIGSVVRSIPHVHLFDSGVFNALASRGDRILPGPYIRSYFGQERLPQLVAKSLVDWCAYYDAKLPGLVIRGPAEVAPGPRSPILETLKSLVDMAGTGKLAFHNSVIPAYRKVTESRSVDAARGLVSLGAKLMIIIHEIAHHILGHPGGASARVEEEDEADFFALICISHFFGQNFSAKGLLLTGAEIPFLLMAPHGKFYSASHPRPFDRAEVAQLWRNVFLPDNEEFFEYILQPLRFSLAGRDLDGGAEYIESATSATYVRAADGQRLAAIPWKIKH